MSAADAELPAVSERLPAGLVREKARSIFSQSRWRLVALLEGSGEAGHCEVDGRRVAIEPTSSELDLRRKLAERERSSEAGPALYLVDWLGSALLPRDLSARVAEGRVYRLRREERLRPIFRAKTLLADLLASPLARLAAAGQVEPFPNATTAGLDLRLACTTWLRQILRGDWAPTRLEEGALVRALRDADAKDWQARWGTARAPLPGDWAEWRAQVGRILAAELSPFCALAWDAWSFGSLHDLAAALWIAEALKLHGASKSDLQLFRVILDDRHPKLATNVLALWPAGEAVATSLLDGWDQLLRGTKDDATPRPPVTAPPGLQVLLERFGTTDFMSASPRLAQGLAAREQDLAEALRAVLAARSGPQSDVAPLTAARAAIDRLVEHRSVTKDRKEQLEMGLRLTFWLWDESRVTEREASDPVRDALAIARRFAGEGGFLDLARRRLEPEVQPTALGEAWGSVRAAVEERLDRLEKRFARGIAEWSRRGRTSDHGCFGIEHAARHLVAGFLSSTPQGAPRRRLLVLMMDGMSWSRCRELLDLLKAEEWSPLRWTPPESGSASEVAPIATAEPLAMLAALPTITSVSRTAFFAGQLPPDGKEPDTQADPARWRDHPDLQGLGGNKPLEVFLKAVVETEQRAPDSKALDKIAHPDLPLVAAVVNTFDDALKAGRSFDYRVTAETIQPVLDLLRAARSARRAVLLVADHGHVPGRRFQRIPARMDSDSRARWRTAEAGEVVEMPEILLREGAWSPEAARPVVLLAGEEATYAKHHHHGEHGGIARAEVVAPAVLIGTPELVEREDGEVLDPGVEAAPPWSPDWWWFNAKSRPTESAAAPTSSRPARPETGSLFEDPAPREAAVEPVAPRSPAKAPPVPAWLTALERSQLFQNACKMARMPEARQARMLEHLRKVLPELVDYNGRVPDARVAQLTATTIERLPGLVSRLTTLLNAEGENCLWHEEATASVRLDIPRLEKLYGIDTGQ